MKFGPIDRCQVCEGPLRSALFVGFLPPVNKMRPLGKPHDAEDWYPAEMLSCPKCHLVQLGYAVDPEILFPPEYPYTSGSTRILRENFQDLYKESKERLRLAPEDLIVDVGSNDGTLLSNWKDGGHKVCGIEPTLTGELARSRGITTLTSFFNESAVSRVLKEHGRPRLVTAANVFAHIHGVREVMACMEKLVGDAGVFISESHYLLDLVETLQYDTIYHEHLRYYSLTSLKYLLNAHGLEVFHVKRIPTHGGSIRVYSSKKGKHPIDASVGKLLETEAKAGLTGDGWIKPFRDRVARSKLALYDLLARVRKNGETGGGGDEGRPTQTKIYGIGMPSRASTLINYVGLDDGVLDCVLEISTSKKIDKFVPGRSIPVLDEKKLYQDQPPYVLLLSWHISDELTKNLKKHGFKGDFIVPLPEPHVVKNGDVKV